MGELLPFPARLSPIERILVQFDRKKLAGFIEVAIGLLDLADGDADLEDDDSDDDNVEDQGEAEPEKGTLHPVYAIDQSKGPINELEAIEDYLRRGKETL